MTCRGKETRLAEIGALGLSFGGVECRFGVLAVGNVVDGKQGLLPCWRNRWNFARVQHQDAVAAGRQIDFDFVILGDVVSRRDPVEEAAERLDVKAMVTEIGKSLSDRIPGLDREASVEGRAGGNDAQLVIEHDKGLANCVDNAVGIGAGSLDLLFRISRTVV